MFNKILIANRGEIAQRIARTCQKLGIAYVGLYSDEDKGSEYLEHAVQRVHLDGSAALDTYLNIQKILQVAIDTECDAVHPGYGFLSENAEFARAIEDHNITLIGPTSEMIGLMGNKSVAKDIMARAGLPVLPGSLQGTSNKEQLISDARSIGYPLIIKPVMGGGGKGMTIVNESDALDQAIDEAFRVAMTAFGDSRLLLEKYLESPRHIEVQIACDHFGNAIHIFDRECSIQRRHQKIIEEAPVTHLSKHVRDQYLISAVNAVKNVGYSNVGTVEFIVEQDQFYFMEMNTRLQVEHTVTEEITGIDLVELQISIASNQPLALKQEDVCVHGHAIQARIYAEDPYQAFKPDPGRVLNVQWPSQVRVDHAFSLTGSISSYYDPMFGKIISYGLNRNTARRDLLAALAQTRILGVKSNTDFLRFILSHQDFVRNDISTDLTDRCLTSAFLDSKAGDMLDRSAVAVASYIQLNNSLKHITQTPWVTNSGAALPRQLGEIHAGKLHFEVENTSYQPCVISVCVNQSVISVEQEEFSVRYSPELLRNDDLLTGTVGSIAWQAMIEEGRYLIQIEGTFFIVTPVSNQFGSQTCQTNTAKSDISGVIVTVFVENEQHIEFGQPLIIIEAMKMETTIFAQKSGIVSHLNAVTGDIVNKGDILLEISDIPSESNV
ncbi:ATP-binding protein [Vibrio jasicida]|uniref:ATP-binding protein n=1 Tax=Vibrio jasicida TaxID=766224 RepID=UPI004068A7A9